MTKHYVVRIGKIPGIYTSRDECLLNVSGYPGAKYKAFKTKEEAEIARKGSYDQHYKTKEKTDRTTSIIPFKKNSIAVDAACSGNPGKVEYQGIDLTTGQIVFYKSFPWGTNNIGEFLALVEGLQYIQTKKSDQYLYSDSKHAINRIQQKKCKTQLEKTKETENTFKAIKEAEERLQNNNFSTKILKRPTDKWGEIPADFGRK